MFFLSGVAHYLFVPFAEAVVFASSHRIPYPAPGSTLVMWFERHNQNRRKMDMLLSGCGRSLPSSTLLKRGLIDPAPPIGLVGTISTTGGVFAGPFSPSAPATGFCTVPRQDFFRQWTRAVSVHVRGPLRDAC